MRNPSANTNTKVRAVIAAILFSVATGFVLYSGALNERAFSQSRKRATLTTVARPRKYSSFPHDVKEHQLQCASCHKFPSANWNKVRAAATAFPDQTDYPKHESCLGCHRQQFYRGRPPVICSICHTNPSPRDSSRHPFPNPREIFDQSPKGKTAETDFMISFPHDKHVDIVTAAGAARSVFQKASFPGRAAAEESCAVCHTTLQPQGTSDEEYVTKPPASIGDGFWLKKGTFKSVPIGHTTCFTCHSQDSGIAPAPTDCATCHKLKQPLPTADFDAVLTTRIGVTERVVLDAWRRRDSSGTFRHEFQSHAELSCDTCHNVQTLNTLDPKTKRVTVSSCSMCHVTATVDDGGAMNYEVQSRKSDPAFQCAKCHVVFGKQPIPQSHIQAIVEAGGKP
ncbi:MAG: cytochrome c3 family protein [Acidobacteriota bacterium]